MKKILFLLLLIPIFLNAQISGIQKQDSLLVIKDKLFTEYQTLKTANSPDTAFVKWKYEWANYQWMQWVESPIDTFQIAVPQRGEPILIEKGNNIKCICEILDTLILIKRDPEITVDGFFNWRKGE